MQIQLQRARSDDIDGSDDGERCSSEEWKSGSSNVKRQLGSGTTLTATAVISIGDVSGGDA